MKDLLAITALLLFLIIGLEGTFGQEQKFAFKHLTGQDGLSDASVNSILQDEKGFMWFATNGGLNRYDGYEFRVYTNIPGDTLSLCDNKVESIYQDPKGNLWVSTISGLCLYNRAQDNFIRSPLRRMTGKSISNNYVRQVLAADGYLWITTLGGGINRYDTTKKTLKYYRHKSNDASSLSMDWVWSVFRDSRNRLWFGTLGEGLNLLSPDKESFQRYKFGEQNAALNTIRCMYELSDNVFLVGTDEGLVRFSPKEDTMKYHLYQHEESNPASISGGHVREIFRDTTGNLWIANQYGLDIYDEKNDRFIHIKSNENKATSINTDEIWDIAQDNQGNVWFGGYKAGLNILNLWQKHFKSWQHDPTNEKSLEGSSVLSFAERQDMKLWIGIDRGGLSLFDRKKGTIRTYKHDPDRPASITANAVLSLFIDDEKQLWAGTWAGGLNKFKPKSQTFEHYSPPTIYFKQWHVWDIMQDAKGRIWTASARGLSCLDEENNSFVTYSPDEDDNSSLSHNACWALLEDSNNKIWIGTSSGLNAYNESSDDFTYYPYQTTDSVSMESYTVYAVHEDSRGRLWIGGKNGLNFLDKKKKVFTNYAKEDGLAGDIIYSIEEDGKGNLWLSTNNGLTQIHIDGDRRISRLYNYGDKTYTGGADFNIGASMESKTGELFFGNNKGFIFFHPDSIRDNTFKPSVVLTGLQIFHKDVPIVPDENSESPLRKALPETKSITLTHEQSIFTLKYAALDFSSPEKIQYAYKLDGLENQWNYVDDKRYATYTNLDAGEYVFMVKAANKDGLWNDTPTKLQITVLPPWWNTWWFKVLTVLALVLIVITIFRLRLRYLRKQKALLKQKVDERTRELKELNQQLDEQYHEISIQNEEINKQNEELEYHKLHLEDIVATRTEELEKAKKKAEESDRLKTSFLANMSHEIRTPLNAIVGFSSLLAIPEIPEEDKKDAIKNINSSSGVLLNLINDIMDLSMIESNQLRIKKEDFSVTDHLNTIYNELKRSKCDKDIPFVLENNLQDKNIIINSDKYRIRQVIVNLVNNAFKFTEEGQIKLSLSQEGGELVYAVSDTGIGITRDQLDSIFERFRKIEEDDNKIYQGSGMGLAISKSISNMLGGRIWVESEEGRGSVFYFAVPYQ